MSTQPSAPIEGALHNLNFGFIEEHAIFAQSYWKSVEEAAFRGDAMAIAVHIKQVRLLTFSVVATLKEVLKKKAPEDAA